VKNEVCSPSTMSSGAVARAGCGAAVASDVSSLVVTVIA
jgi:hypothetical protein